MNPDKGSHGRHRLRLRRRGGIAAIMSWLLFAPVSHADGLSDDGLWRYRSSGVAVNGGVVAATPTAFPTGLAKGLGGGITVGRTLTWGAQVSWATATESTIGWTVSHDDFAFRLTGGAHASVGRGMFGLQLGLGTTLVHEIRHRIRGDVAGSTGMALETTATAIGPAAGLDAVIRLHLTGSWMMVMSGGPSLTRLDRALHTGWTTHLGIAWQL
jgi:hypothetical protein